VVFSPTPSALVKGIVPTKLRSTPFNSEFVDTEVVTFLVDNRPLYFSKLIFDKRSLSETSTILFFFFFLFMSFPFRGNRMLTGRITITP